MLHPISDVVLSAKEDLFKLSKGRGRLIQSMSGAGNRLGARVASKMPTQRPAMKEAVEKYAPWKHDGCQ